jgi:ribonucleoside-diphosphate reductase alpha chain
MTLTVTKRDGNLELYNVYKIKKVINWACEDVEDVEPIVLESSLQLLITDWISTVEIHEQLIQKAKELISLEQPNWKYVAGRLLMQTIWKDSKSKRGFTYDNYDAFISWLEEQKNKDIYKYHLQEGFYSSEELKEAYSYIKPERDFLFDYSGSFLLKQRYLLPNELPQEMFLIIALLISKDEPNKLELVKQIYDGLSLLKISFATPILLNFRKPNGNTSSCFTLTVDDSLDSIYDNLKNAARISKQGGGVGACLSNVRATGSSVNGNLNASGGVLPWIKLFNDTAVAVNQVGYFIAA